LNSSDFNSQIEKIAALIVSDKTSPDEQDPEKLKKYYDYAKKTISAQRRRCSTASK